MHPSLLRSINDLGFSKPTPIQADAIPPALQGRDVLASAQTGSGKTAAFLLPILHRLLDKPRGTTRALILAPTRELAAQILADMRDLAKHTPIKGTAIFGGVSHGPQEDALRRGVDIVVATPGRLLDHLREAHARFDRLEYLVLDEADRMLDMGFLPDIRRILNALPKERQTLFFSATMPHEIRGLVREMLRQPAVIEREKTSVTPAAITQAVYPVAQDLKSALLIELLKRGDIAQALVFTRTKHRANRLAEALSRAGIDAARIHGNRTQAQRTAALDAFKNGRCPVLVATDIAARGIDVEELGHVVNFDVPLAVEDYIHRIGRTGRAEASGAAVTFMAPDERGDIAAIERVVGRALPRVTLADFNYDAKPAVKLEVPLAQRIAEIRARKAQDRARANANQQRRAAHGQGQPSRQGHGPARTSGGAHSGGGNSSQRPPKHRFRPRRDNRAAGAAKG